MVDIVTFVISERKNTSFTIKSDAGFSFSVVAVDSFYCARGTYSVLAVFD